MLKRIYLPFLALSIISCSSDMTTEMNTSSQNKIKNNVTLKNNDPLAKAALELAYLDLETTLKIKAVLEAENDKDRFFGEDVNIADELNLVTNDTELDQLFVSKGMDASNSKLLVNLMNEKKENMSNFVSKNPDFKLLSFNQQQTVISTALMEVYLENPDGIFTPGSGDATTDPVVICRRNRAQGYKDCTEDFHINGGAALVLTVFTGGWGLVGVGASILSYDRCLNRNERNYHNCMDDAGQAFH